jgi:hypothetical protein
MEVRTARRPRRGASGRPPLPQRPALCAALPVSAAAIVRSTSWRRIIGSSERDMHAGTLIWNACSTSFTSGSWPAACRYLWVGGGGRRAGA